MSSQSTGRIAGVRASYPVPALTHFSGEVSAPPRTAAPERPVRTQVPPEKAFAGTTADERGSYWR